MKDLLVGSNCAQKELLSLALLAHPHRVAVLAQIKYRDLKGKGDDLHQLTISGKKSESLRV
jgi:hypothetical protein